MRNAEIILSTIADRGRRGLPLEGVYRLLYNRELYLMAYGRISSNKGATTPGVTSETADAMSLAKIDGIIEQIRKETYRWTPVRRSYIPKANGKKRPLGIPTWSDRMLQEVIRLILDAYYDPQFTDRSCGFRTGMGCHTALRQVSRWKGTTWFIEGDITGCFDNIDHDVLMQIIREKIHDGRFCRLLDELLRAGYLEDWKYNPTLSGTPQGGIVSPLLSNIYLDRLDQYVEQTLIPQYTRGLKRRRNPTYLSREQSSKYWQEHGQIERAMAIRKDMQRYPSIDVNDPGFRRLNYVRYADDFLLGFIGPKEEAEAIKRQVGEFLRDTLKLELSESKTLVTHGRTEAAKFLGYEVSTAHVDDKHTKPENHRWTARWTNGVILLRVPKSFVTTKMAPFQRDGRAMHRPERMQDEAFSIVSQYAAEYRGFVQYYKLAINLRILNQLRYAMESSLVKTLAGKFRTQRSEIYRRYHVTIQTEKGPRKALQVKVAREGKEPLVATWGMVRLERNPNAVISDQPRRVWNTRSEIVERMLAGECELCGSTESIEIHHIRALKDLKRPGQAERPLWVQKMAERRRKKLVVCRPCHSAITHGKGTAYPTPTGVA